MAATYNHKHKQFVHGNYIFYFFFFISAIQTEDYFMLDIILIFDPFLPQLKKD